jgi:hypothetical protein
VLQPLVDLRRIEAQQVAELDVGDAALGDEPADVTAGCYVVSSFA